MLAVGTTSVRTLESAALREPQGPQNGAVPEALEGREYVRTGTSSTSIFMYPGYQFKVVDKMFTNFHTPESTLIMLVSAFAGREHILSAYKTAVVNRYRFFSYGDCMFIK